MTASRTVAIVLTLGGLFVIGFTLMGYEMLGSRYLNPYFGSGITTWASLISVVLLSMMIGYMAGGYAVDAYPGVELLAGCAFAAGLCLLLAPVVADSAIAAILERFGDGFWGVLIASMTISFLPIALLSACSPFVVRLLLVDLAAGGKTTGLVYSVSTFGNVFGTLTTTFYLIPHFGTRAITSGFGGVLVALALLIVAFRLRISHGLKGRGAAPVVVAVLLAAAFVMAPWGVPAPAAFAASAVELDASYPEGPIWVGDRLLYAEMSAGRVMEWKEGPLAAKVYWQEGGCGPTAISVYKQTDLIVLCHLGAKLVHLDAQGRKVAEFRASKDGVAFQDPNDCFEDGQGGVLFSDSGVFNSGAASTGRVYHLSSHGVVTEAVRGLKYANGVHYDPQRKRLLVSEHLARKVWAFTLDDAFSVTGKALFLDVDAHLDPKTLDYPETGPDGIEADAATGDIYIPLYGAGRLFVIKADGEVRTHTVPMKYVTNIAISKTLAAVVGAFVNDRMPFPGKVQIYRKDAFFKEFSDEGLIHKQ
jgi:sugar lactone lactonase YvrE